MSHTIFEEKTLRDDTFNFFLKLKLFHVKHAQFFHVFKNLQAFVFCKVATQVKLTIGQSCRRKSLVERLLGLVQFNIIDLNIECDQHNEFHFEVLVVQSSCHYKASKVQT